MPTALIQINDGLKPCSPLIPARPRTATDRPRTRSEAAVEGQADPASDISSTPRPVGLVGCLMARRYQDQYTWQASRRLEIAIPLRWFVDPLIDGVPSRTGARARYRH